ncbi:MAG: phosphatase PAP2 family protein [Clostridia bacterium]|nr:phosphatase PAP2 family protein [Clostridia bacterium]
MKRIQQLLLKIMPGYAWFPIGAVLFLNFFTYLVPRMLYDVHPYGYVSFIELPVDDMIPFVPAFMSIYLLCYLQWVEGFIMVGREGKSTCYRLLTAEMIAKSICLFCYFVLPTTMERPELAADGGFWEQVCSVVYGADQPNNLFPSIHCLESWFCFRAAMHMKKTGKWHVAVHLVFALLVLASVVLVKQHLLLDIPAGILAVEIGLLCSRKISFARFFEGGNKLFIKLFTKKERSAS